MIQPEITFSMDETFELPFSIERHINTFINYCECIIDEDGTIEYATPSHELKMLDILMLKRNLTIDQVRDIAAKEQGQWDWINWLMRNSKCMCVYTCGYAIPDDEFMTNKQRESLQSLIDVGLVEDRRIII